MAKFTGLLSRVRLVYKRSSTLTKVMVLCAIVLSTAALLTLHWILADTQAQTDALRSQAAQLEQENSKLEEQIDALGSVDSITDIAENELGLVDPDTIVIQPED